MGRGTVTAKNRRKKAKGVWKLSSCKDRWPYKPSCLTRLGKGGSLRGRGREKRNGFTLKRDPPTLRHLLQAGDRQSCQDRQAGRGRWAGKPHYMPSIKIPHPTTTLNPSPFPQEPRALPGGQLGMGQDGTALTPGLTQTLHTFSAFHCSPMAPSSLSS